MLPTPATVASLFALMMQRYGKTRARISNVTLKSVSRRSMLRAKFLSDVRSELEEWGYLIVPLDRGGFGLLSSASLEGAPPITAKGLIPEELAALKKNDLNEDAVWAELAAEVEEPQEET
ncbi:hypothetical protein [Mesorhizobium sp. LSHC412B00]|uniref:hypothetical protein n=1 Tax=Mesorhizobium sp. LSHC412B00 TaxID=1287285 RepID=UPI0004CF96B7|nr:hypothetical protein [Mesorhizobium sp. LSHC412B00]